MDLHEVLIARYVIGEINKTYDLFQIFCFEITNNNITLRAINIRMINFWKKET